MALDWLPIYPPPQPRPKRRWTYDQAERLNVLPIPNPPPPTELTWRTTYPATIVRRTLPRSAMPSYVSGTPFLGTQLQARTSYPDGFPRKRLAVPSGSPFQIGGILGVPKTGGWRPSYPSVLAHRYPTRVGASVWIVDPTTLMNAAPCVEWTDETVTLPRMEGPLTGSDVISGALLLEDGFYFLLEDGGHLLLDGSFSTGTVLLPTFTEETVTPPTLTEEDVC